MVKILGVITEQWDNAKRAHGPQERMKGKDKNVSEIKMKLLRSSVGIVTTENHNKRQKR